MEMPIFESDLQQALAIPAIARSRASAELSPLEADRRLVQQSSIVLEHQVRVDRAWRRSRSAPRGGGPRAARRTRRRAPPAGGCPRGSGAWWTVGAARAATGIGTRSGPVARSLRTSSVVSVGDRLDRLRRRCARARASRPVLALVERPGDVDRRRCAAPGAGLRRSRSSSRSVRIGCVELDLVDDSRLVASRLPWGPIAVRQAHHDVLADRVDRRVRDLREALLEVGEERRARGRRRTASARSLPIEPVGSRPSRSSGASSTRRSSCV